MIPGHGPLSNVNGLRAFQTMLRETSTLVRNGVRAGKTAQQLKEEKVLAKYDSYSWEFINTDKWIDTLVRDAAMKRKTKS